MNDITHLFWRGFDSTVAVSGNDHHRHLWGDGVLLASQSTKKVTAIDTLVAIDRQTSVMGRLDENGQRDISYTPYGAGYPPHSEADAHVAFAGYHRSAPMHAYVLGCGKRYYNPRLMRFSTTDRLSPFGKGGLNAYAYCEGEPVNYQDSSGTVKTPAIRKPKPSGQLARKRLQRSQAPSLQPRSANVRPALTHPLPGSAHQNQVGRDRQAPHVANITPDQLQGQPPLSELTMTVITAELISKIENRSLDAVAAEFFPGFTRIGRKLISYSAAAEMRLRRELGLPANEYIHAAKTALLMNSRIRSQLLMMPPSSPSALGQPRL